MSHIHSQWLHIIKSLQKLRMGHTTGALSSFLVMRKWSFRSDQWEERKMSLQGHLPNPQSYNYKKQLKDGEKNWYWDLRARLTFHFQDENINSLHSLWYISHDFCLWEFGIRSNNILKLIFLFLHMTFSAWKCIDIVRGI